NRERQRKTQSRQESRAFFEASFPGSLSFVAMSKVFWRAWLYLTTIPKRWLCNKNRPRKRTVLALASHSLQLAARLAARNGALFAFLMHVMAFLAHFIHEIWVI